MFGDWPSRVEMTMSGLLEKTRSPFSIHHEALVAEGAECAAGFLDGVRPAFRPALLPICP